MPAPSIVRVGLQVKWLGCVARGLTILALAIAAGLPVASAQTRDAGAQLRQQVEALHRRVDSSVAGPPMLVDSSDEGDSMRGAVGIEVDSPFNRLAARLRDPFEWCSIILLHLNAKSCNEERSADGDTLTVFVGRKLDEGLDSAYKLKFEFRAAPARGDVLEVELSAPTGPLNTADYRIAIVAIPTPAGAFVHLDYSYRSSSLSRIAMGAYLSTFGRAKIGFSITGKGVDGKPEHVKGRRGIVERNAARYLFAIDAWLQTANTPAADRVERALMRWFDLTERYPAQLHEVDRDDYLRVKRRQFEER